MSAQDSQHWNKHYQNCSGTPQPAAVLTDNAHLLPRQGGALDLACGVGANALWLAERGLSVSAWDCSAVALAKLNAAAEHNKLQINTRVVDLNTQPLPVSAFDLIVVSHYLQRDLCPAITSALKSGGLLAYQTFTREKPAQHLKGPRNPDYLLAPGELLKLFAELALCAYREERGLGDLQQGLRNQAYLLARKS